MPAGTDPDFAALSAACARLGVALAPAGYDALTRFAALLREWNQRINLISRRDTARILSYHCIDSLAAAPLLEAGARICDLGSGAGLPGIPLAIVRPDLDVALLESSHKRGLFLQATIGGLALGNCRLVAGRAEELTPLECDAVLSRLTGSLDDTIEWAARHIRRPTGQIILYKTREPIADRRRFDRLCARLVLSPAAPVDVALPFAGFTRRFLILRPSA